MTADRLDLDALEAEVREWKSWGEDEWRCSIDEALALIAASRDAKTLTDERYEWERMVVEREEHTHRQIAKTKIVRAEAERDAAQAALARVTALLDAPSDERGIAWWEWIKDGLGGSLHDDLKAVLKPDASEGQEAGD